MNSKPTYVFSSSETAVEIGRQIDRDKNNYLSSTYACFDGNEKRFSKMATLSLSLYHTLLHKQSLLATVHCESENKENPETFWNLWNEALSSSLEKRCMFNPAGLILDDKGLNWNAIKNVFGCEFVERSISCEFHFTQSVNRKMNDSMFTNSEDREKFRNLTRKMLEIQTEIQFKTAVTNLESFITERKRTKFTE